MTMDKIPNPCAIKVWRLGPAEMPTDSQWRFREGQPKNVVFFSGSRLFLPTVTQAFGNPQRMTFPGGIYHKRPTESHCKWVYIYIYLYLEDHPSNLLNGPMLSMVFVP